MAKYQQELEEAEIVDVYESIESIVTACQLRATKLMVRALELKYQASKRGDFDARRQCEQVLGLLFAITRRGQRLFAISNESSGYTGVDESVQNAVEVICTRCEMQLSAIAAELGGRYDVAAKWLAAAKVCAGAMSRDADAKLDECVCWGWERHLERAEVLAGQAHRAEEVLAEQARRAEDALVQQEGKAERGKAAV